MKKTILKMMTTLLFLGALVITLSTGPKPGFSLVNKSQAFDPQQKGYVLVCSNGDKITACGVGSSDCTAVGQCGPQG